jgi:hypothetical protein
MTGNSIRFGPFTGRILRISVATKAQRSIETIRYMHNFGNLILGILRADYIMVPREISMMFHILI